MIGGYETLLEDGAIYELAVTEWHFCARLEKADGKLVAWSLLNLDPVLPSLWVKPNATLAYLETEGYGAETILFLPDEIYLQHPIWEGNVAMVGDLTRLNAEESFDTAFWGEVLR